MFITKQDFIDAICLYQTWKEIDDEVTGKETGKETNEMKQKRLDFICSLSNKEALFLLDFYHNITHDKKTFYKIFEKSVDSSKLPLDELKDGIYSIIIFIFDNLDSKKKMYMKTALSSSKHLSEPLSISLEETMDCLKINMSDKIPFITRKKFDFYLSGNYYVDQNRIFPIEYIQRLDDHTIQGMNSDMKKYIRKRKEEVTELNQKWLSVVNELDEQYRNSLVREITKLGPIESVALSKIYHSFSYKISDILREKRLLKNHVFQTESDWNSFQQILNNRLKSINMNQEKLINLTGLDKKTIQKYLRGKPMKFILVTSLFKLSCVLECSYDYLIGKSDVDFTYFDPSGTKWTIPFKRIFPMEYIFTKLSEIDRKSCFDTLKYITDHSADLSDTDFEKIQKYAEKLSEKINPEISMQKHTNQ